MDRAKIIFKSSEDCICARIMKEKEPKQRHENVGK